MNGMLKGRICECMDKTCVQKKTAHMIRMQRAVSLITGVLIPVFLLFPLFVTVSVYGACDYAEILPCIEPGKRMCLLSEGQGDLFGPALCEYETSFSWACPCCGIRDNTLFINRCCSCGYPADNPDGLLFRPFDRGRITNIFSEGHKAVDYGIPAGSPVYAAQDGVVVRTANDRWSGNVLRLLHKDGMETLYGHLDAFLVIEGSIVRMGDIIARTGSTGVSSGPHLHFEVRIDGIPVNPLCYLPDE